jgi:hypothetical protein
MRRLAFDIPPEEAVALLLVLLEMGMVAWQRRKIGLSSRVYRFRRDMEFAMDHDHGFSELLQQTVRHLRVTRPG